MPSGGSVLPAEKRAENKTESVAPGGEYFNQGDIDALLDLRETAVREAALIAW